MFNSTPVKCGAYSGLYYGERITSCVHFEIVKAAQRKEVFLLVPV